MQPWTFRRMVAALHSCLWLVSHTGQTLWASTSSSAVAFGNFSFTALSPCWYSRRGLKSVTTAATLWASTNEGTFSVGSPVSRTKGTLSSLRKSSSTCRRPRNWKPRCRTSVPGERGVRLKSTQRGCCSSKANSCAFSNA
eukprot:scaffold2626_cov279-Pinguiococcus_pyrenoidosus.AAC.1